jgi:hypothetical protein
MIFSAVSRRRLFALVSLVCALSIAAIRIAAIRADDSPKPPAPDATKYTLCYKFKPGELIRMQVWHRANLETTIAGTTQTAETTSGSVKAWRVQGVDSQGNMTFEHSVESVDLRQKVSGRQEITYNSQTDKSPPPLYEASAKSVGVPLATVTIDPSGKILKKTDKRSGATSEPLNSQMVTPLSADPVAVGESWNQPLDVTITLEQDETKIIKTRQHYTLDKVAHGIATISIETQVLTPVTNPKIQSQLVQHLKQGTFRFDIDAGRMVAEQLELDERVLGFQGPDSSLHFVGRFTEEYLPPPSKTAAKPKTTK